MFFGRAKDATELEKSIEEGFLNLDLHAVMYAGLLQDLCGESGLKLSSNDIRIVLIVLYWSFFAYELGYLKDKKTRDRLNLFALLQFTTRFKKEFDNYEDYDFEDLLKSGNTMMGLVMKYVEPGKGTTMNGYVKATQDLINMWSENKEFRSTPVFYGLIDEFLKNTFSPIMATVLNFNIKYKLN